MTFMVQGDLRADGKRQSIRVKVGEVGRLQTREARAKAKRILGSIVDGVDPRPKPPTPKAPAGPSTDPTLREAWTAYRDSHMRRKGRSEGTVASYTDHFERLLKDWLDERLSKFGHEPGLLKQRHDQLTVDNGPYIANGAMRSFRAIYNHARKSARGLPAENPVLAVDWNPEKRRDTGMGVADPTGWWKELQALENPLRREFHLFLLLSGSRPDPIKRARLEHADLRRRILHIPRPKGGEDRAFDIPLSREMVRCLIRAMRLGRAMYPEQAQTWLFPADSELGHLVEHKEDRRELSKWGGDLRQTYRTLGQAAGGERSRHAPPDEPLAAERKCRLRHPSQAPALPPSQAAADRELPRGEGVGVGRGKCDWRKPRARCVLQRNEDGRALCCATIRMRHARQSG